MVAQPGARHPGRPTGFPGKRCALHLSRNVPVAVKCSAASAAARSRVALRLRPAPPILRAPGESLTPLLSVWSVVGLGLSCRAIARGNEIVLKLLLLCVGEYDGAAPRGHVVHCRVGGRPG
jgi:hypothetical protein